MDLSKLRDISVDDLKRAADIREEIDRLEGELEAILSGNAPAKRGRKKKAAKKKRKAKRKISPEGLARIKAAQKKRWDAIRAKQGGSAKKKAIPKKKRGRK